MTSRGVGIKDFVTTVLNCVTMGGGLLKIIKKCVTSFMDNPLVKIT